MLHQFGPAPLVDDNLCAAPLYTGDGLQMISCSYLVSIPGRWLSIFHALFICGSLFRGYATAALVPTALDFTPGKWTFTFHGCWPGCWESWRWWWARFTSAGSHAPAMTRGPARNPASIINEAAYKSTAYAVQEVACDVVLLELARKQHFMPQCMHNVVAVV